MNRDWYEYVVNRLDLPGDIKREVFYWTFGSIWAIDSAIIPKPAEGLQQWMDGNIKIQKHACIMDIRMVLIEGTVVYRSYNEYKPIWGWERLPIQEIVRRTRNNDIKAVIYLQ